MRFELSEDQQLMTASLSRYCQEQIPLETVRATAALDQDDGAIWRGLTELGLTGVMIAEQAGGSGLGLLDAALVSEQFGYHVVPEHLFGAVMAAIALQAGKTDVYADKLASIAADEMVVGVGMTELAGQRESAKLSIKGGKVSGTTLFVRDYQMADALMLCTASGAVLWLDNKDGIEAVALTTIDRTRRYAQITCKNAPATVLADGDAGSALATELLAAARVLIAADSLGAAQAMLDKAVAYSLERKQFNRAIGSFQAVKHLCAQMAADLEPCRALLWYSAHCHQTEPEKFALQACILKSHIDEIAKFIARTATEVHGGMGFTDLMGLHFWFKRIGLNRQLLGGPELVRAEAARLAGYC